jgi:hypothetical protein
VESAVVSLHPRVEVSVTLAVRAGERPRCSPRSPGHSGLSPQELATPSATGFSREVGEALRWDSPWGVVDVPQLEQATSCMILATKTPLRGNGNKEERT